MANPADLRAGSSVFVLQGVNVDPGGGWDVNFFLMNICCRFLDIQHGYIVYDVDMRCQKNQPSA